MNSLGESTERYHTLVEATTEGTLLVLDDRCRYANPTFLSMLGYTARQLEFLELADVLPREPDNAAIWARLRGESGEPASADEPLEGCLARRDGSLLECLLALNPILFAGQPGFILLAKDLARSPAALSDDGLAAAAQVAADRHLPGARRPARRLRGDQPGRPGVAPAPAGRRRRAARPGRSLRRAGGIRAILPGVAGRRRDTRPRPPPGNRRRSPRASSPCRPGWCAMSRASRPTSTGCWKMSPRRANRRRGARR